MPDFKYNISRVWSTAEAKAKPWSTAGYIAVIIVSFFAYVLFVNVWLFTLSDMMWYGDASFGPHPMDERFQVFTAILSTVSFVVFCATWMFTTDRAKFIVNRFSAFAVHYGKRAMKDIKKECTVGYANNTFTSHHNPLLEKMAGITNINCHLLLTHNNTSHMTIFKKDAVDDYMIYGFPIDGKLEFCVEGEKNMFFLQLSSDIFIDNG